MLFGKSNTKRGPKPGFYKAANYSELESCASPAEKEGAVGIFCVSDGMILFLISFDSFSFEYIIN